MRTGIILLLLSLLVTACSSEKQEVNIIPQPQSIILHGGSFEITAATPIAYSVPELEEAAGYLAAELRKHWQLNLPVGLAASGKGISFHLDPALGEEDTYTMNVDGNGVKIAASNPRAIVLAIQTLKQLLLAEPTGHAVAIPAVTIRDSPHWAWRGLHLDVARHFFSIDEVKEFIDLMAFYKFNKFHWHLTDDQGWRVEIKKYPLLTQKAGWRTYNGHDLSVMNLAEKESNTDYLLPESKLRREGDTFLYGGFYTQEEIRNVVAYAAGRGIDIIPEVDMPGHFTGAIQNYPWISCFNKTGWGVDFSEPLCPGKDAALTFCKDVYQEIFALFPYEYVHLGADEVDKSNWKKCPHCQRRMAKEKLNDEKELQSWFVSEMEAFFVANGKKMIGWDEIIEGGLSRTAVVMWWRSWMKNAVNIATSQGNEVILTPNDNYYFDYQQHAKTLRTLYEFSPLPAGLTPEQKALVKGVQANTWAEYIPSRERFQYMTMPRLLAMSEVAWRADSLRRWNNFYPRLLAHYKTMDRMGINYRPLDLDGVHTVNAFVGETLVTWAYPLPDVEIYYTMDGNVPDKRSLRYTQPFKLTESADFTIRFFRPDGSAADIVSISYRKEEYRSGAEVENPQAGLKCTWREAVVKHTSEIDALPVKEEYVIDRIVVPDGVGGKRALLYSGYLNIEREDVYTFSLGSDDGSKLYINDEAVIDNDGPHGPLTLTGQVALGKGYQPLRLYYFDMNNGGFLFLKMYDSSGKEIPLTEKIFFH